MPPFFSIILPTYNRAHVLWRAILSVLAQSEPRWELIVVDDGSTDHTPRLMEEFRDARIRYVVKANGGPAAARNYGAHMAQAPYVAYLDSDNTWRPTYLATMHGAIEARPDARLWYCGQETTIWQRSAQGVWTHRFTGPEPRAQYGLMDALDLQGADANCIVHRRELLDAIDGWDENCRWLEDWDFFLRCMLYDAAGVVWVDGVLVEYRQIHGEGADGICGEVSHDGYAELAARQYLLEKWGDHLSPAGLATLGVSVDELLVRRDRALRKYALQVDG